ncbi:hypothetical protein TNCV_4270591 [Trichonephila clavipes]|nr:hypothetical protein TNCV_4270591 [Trichonephila clavipes]
MRDHQKKVYKPQHLKTTYCGEILFPQGGHKWRRTAGLPLDSESSQIAGIMPLLKVSFSNGIVQPAVARPLSDISDCICRCWNAPGYRCLFFAAVGLLTGVVCLVFCCIDVSTRCSGHLTVSARLPLFWMPFFFLDLYLTAVLMLLFVDSALQATGFPFLPLQAAESSLPPPLQATGSSLPPPLQATGSSLPPPLQATGSSLPPPLQATGSSLPPPLQATGSSLPPPLQATGSSFPPPLQATGSSFPPPLQATGSSFPPPLQATGSSFPPPLQATGSSFPPPLQATRSSLPPPLQASLISITARISRPR